MHVPGERWMVRDEALELPDVVPEALSRRIAHDREMDETMLRDDRWHRLEEAQNILVRIHAADVDDERPIGGNAVARAGRGRNRGIVDDAEDGIGGFGHDIDAVL